MTTMNISPELHSLLDSLTQFLSRQGTRAHFSIVGSFALELKGYKRHIHTSDIDLISEPEREDLSDEINRIGQSANNEMWMNLNAASLPLPLGFEARTEVIKYNERISFSVPSRKDMIILKVAAAAGRIHDDAKDIQDLKLLTPTLGEVEEGFKFYRSTNLKEITGTRFEYAAISRMDLVRRLLGF